MGARGIRPPARWLALGVILSMAGAVALEVAREAAFPRDTVAEAVLYFPSGRAVTHLALSYDALLADVYWIRALQHFGSTRLKKDLGERKYTLLEPLLTITTTLDPQFNVAYRFGAIFLSEAPPGGPGRPDQAIALLQRGLEAKPGNWRYMQDIGFVYYWWLRDFPKAAEWFNRGADQPGAPWWLRSLAANTLAQGGDRQASRALWQALAQTPDNEWLQRDARRRLLQLDALDAIADLNARVRRYREAGGRPPFTWQSLVQGRWLREVPLDPTGVPYELGPYSGDVGLNDTSPLNPLPAEPPPIAPR
jgi:tetratricopeptide (TPR) repeat protein